MKRLLAPTAKSTIAALGFGCFGYCAAAHTIDAPTFVADLGPRVEVVLSARQGDAERVVAVQSLLEQVFDFPGLSRYVLGPYWNNASDEQRQEFSHLFLRYIAHICASEMSDYTGHMRITVTGSRIDADSRVLVASQVGLPGGQPPARVEWRIAHDEASNRITDIIVEGVSFAQTQRQQFTSLIRRNSGQMAPTLVQLRRNLGDN